MLGIVVVLGACGGGGSSAKGSNATTKSPSTAAAGAPTTSATTTTAGAVDPNVPEVVEPGDIPDNQVFVAFTAPDGSYSLKVPEGWAQSVAGPTVIFTDHFNTVAATTSSVPIAPTPAGVQSAEVPMLQTETPNFELEQVSSVDRTAGPAVLVTYRAGSALDPVTGKRVALDVERYEFWRNGEQVTLTLSGARGSDNVDPWRTVTDSFAWAA